MQIITRTLGGCDIMQSEEGISISCCFLSRCAHKDILCEKTTNHQNALCVYLTLKSTEDNTVNNDSKLQGKLVLIPPHILSAFCQSLCDILVICWEYLLGSCLKA